MAALQDNSARRVKDAVDILEVIGEHVHLQKAGVRYKGLCPFHSEKTPSFTINRERQFYHCFGCNESGDVLSFMMKYHNLTFPDAVARLAERYGIELEESKLSPEELKKTRERESLFAVNSVAATIFHKYLLENPAAAQARQYLEKRGMSQEMISRFQLGYAPDRWDFLAQALASAGEAEQVAVAAGLLVQKEKGGVYDRFRDRVIFPIFSLNGQVAAFGGRILGDGQPKYLNSPESSVFNKSQTLFGLYQNKSAIREAGRCLVVEGNFDLLSLVAHGLQYVAAPLGTALTAQHVKILKRYAEEAVVVFDGDQAGLKAAMRAVPLFLTEQLDAKIVVLPEEHDPDTFVAAFGKEALEEKVARAMELSEFVFSRLVKEHGLSLAGKNKIVRELQPLIAAIGNRTLQKSLFVSHFSDKLGLKAEDLLGRGEGGIHPVGPSLPAKRRKQGLKLSKQYEKLLEFLLIYPEALPHFLEAGLDELVDNENDSARIILDQLKDLDLIGQGDGAEVLLENLLEEEKVLVARLLIEAPSYAEDMKDLLIDELTTWVRKQAWQNRKSRLLRRISQAQVEGDDVLLMELLEQKKKMDEVSYT
ncbi:MAG: DNA primase [Proteobacteria bacterium]|nr:DNA primase [Pseudomonadota bacterium]MBU0968194.1 DNA primase [Pseudomonadota bacterium]